MAAAGQAAEGKEEQMEGGKGSSLNSCSAQGTSPANPWSQGHLASSVRLDLMV